MQLIALVDRTTAAARKVFSLTEVGKAELHHARSAWDQMGQALLSLENADRKVPK
ncbi:hypothetical protein [Kineococcus auxinigenes]|uniref:hypothetical protein n=1 Tax=unclassified Kineococcus TaxID=2621656 RepID=UPI003D7D4880